MAKNDKFMEEYRAHIRSLIKKYHDAKDAEAELYYQGALKCSAPVEPFYETEGFDTHFQGGWGYHAWKMSHQTEIDALKRSYKKK